MKIKFLGQDNFNINIYNNYVLFHSKWSNFKKKKIIKFCKISIMDSIFINYVNII